MALALGSVETRVAAIASTDQLRIAGDGANLWRVERRGTGMNLVWYENNIFRSSRPITGITITANDKIASVCNENASNLFVAIYFTTGTARTEVWRVPKVTTGNSVATRLSQAISCARRNEMGADFDGQKWVGNHLGVIKRVDNITTSSPTACNFNNTIVAGTFSNTALPVGSAEVQDGSDDKLLILRQDGNLYEVTPNTTTSGTTITPTLVGSVGTAPVEALGATTTSSTTKNLYYTRGGVLYRRVLTHAAEPAAAAGNLNINDKSVTLAPGASGTVTLEAATGGTGTVAYAIVGPPTGLSLGVTNRVLTISSTYPAGTRNVTVRATWTQGSSTAMTTDVFALTVVRRAPTPNAVAGTFNPGDQTITLTPNTAGSQSFTAATGGTGTVSYSLRYVLDDNDENALGITIGTGASINVASSVSAGTYTMGIRATWTSGSTTATADSEIDFTIRRQAPSAVAGSFNPGNVTISGAPNTQLTGSFNAATGGTGTISYALLVNGGATISVSGTTITVGATQAAGTFRIAVRARWTSGSTTADNTQFFNVVIARREPPVTPSTPTTRRGGFDGAAMYFMMRRMRKQRKKRDEDDE